MPGFRRSRRLDALLAMTRNYLYGARKAGITRGDRLCVRHVDREARHVRQKLAGEFSAGNFLRRRVIGCKSA